MAPQTTTGIVLIKDHHTNTFRLQQPGKPDCVFQDADLTHLDEVSGRARLTEGYWLRKHSEPTRTTYTWVQL